MGGSGGSRAPVGVSGWGVTPPSLPLILSSSCLTRGSIAQQRAGRSMDARIKPTAVRLRIWRRLRSARRWLSAVSFEQAMREGLALDGRPACFERSEEHTSELQSLMRISYAVFCLKKKNLTKPENVATTY